MEREISGARTRVWPCIGYICRSTFSKWLGISKSVSLTIPRRMSLAVRMPSPRPIAALVQPRNAGSTCDKKYRTSVVRHVQSPTYKPVLSEQNRRRITSTPQSPAIRNPGARSPSPCPDASSLHLLSSQVVSWSCSACHGENDRCMGGGSLSSTIL